MPGSLLLRDRVPPYHATPDPLGTVRAVGLLTLSTEQEAQKEAPDAQLLPAPEKSLQGSQDLGDVGSTEDRTM